MQKAFGEMFTNHNDSVKKVTGYVLTFGGSSGVNNVANMWEMHFEKNLNCIDSVKEKDSFYKNRSANNVNIERLVIYITDVIKCVQEQKG